MANNARDLKKRLLHLFPVKTIKEFFQKKGGSEDIIEGLSNNPINPLIDFALQNYKYTRQNIFLFTIDHNFNRASIGADFPLTIEKETHIGNEYTFACFPKTTFSVYLSNPTDKEDLVFYQPVFIRCYGKNLVVHFTKMEKSIASYYNEQREAKKASVKNAQDIILKSIVDYFATNYTVVITDFNKGIKAIWAADDIDCHKIQSKNAHSVRVETMDGVLTYKVKYPLEYNAIILTPLRSAQWKYLRDDSYICDGFTADPGAGEISITSFPKHINQVTNVIDKILASN
jgi:hypothetical protein